jgi:hypothetical protein
MNILKGFLVSILERVDRKHRGFLHKPKNEFLDLTVLSASGKPKWLNRLLKKYFKPLKGDI